LSDIFLSDVRGEPFDVVLLDLALKDMNGEAVAAAIRSNRSLKQPRLVLTGAFDAQVSAAAAAAGVDAFLTKPMRGAALVERLAAVAAGESETLAPAPQAPATAEPAIDLADSAAPAAAQPSAGRQGRVLLAEDNEINTMLACAILQAGGYEIDCVVNGEEAVRAVRDRTYDLVLMDMQMPVMDGLQATGLIRALPAPAGQTPIVAMTANAMRKDQDACLAAGMNDFVSKPFEPDAFLRIVARYMPIDLWDDDDAAPASASVAAAPDLDEAKFDGLVALLPPDRLDRMIHSYIEAARQRLLRMDKLVAAQKYADLAREAHALKGAAGGFGAVRLVALSEQLERACLANDDAETPRLVREIERACARVETALNRRRAEIETSARAAG
jgi:CheY-like chemotaxis protein